MTAATKDIKTSEYGTPDEVFPSLHSFPVAAATTIYAGTMVATDASGNAVPATASTALKLWGRCELTVANTVAAGYGTAGDRNVDVRAGVFYLNNGSGSQAITNANRGSYCYAVDDNVVGISDAGGTLPLAGLIFGLGQTGVNTGKVAVGIGVPFTSPYVNNPELYAAQTSYKARVVATSIGAYTASAGVITITATGALGAQDGVTLVAGDVLFIQEGTANVTAADAGPYTVTTIGTTGVSAVLTRPDWYPHGGALVPGTIIDIGGEGTGTNPTLAGTRWKSFAAKSKIIGTDAPVFWPQKITCAVTLASGTLAAARTTMPVRSHLVTDFVITSDPATAPHANTRVWRVSALTAGVTGTASVQMVAESAPGTTNASDVGQYNLTAINF